MGKEVAAPPLAFVSFRPKDRGFLASISLEGLVSREADVEIVLSKAGDVYARQIDAMRSTLADISELRTSNRLIPARSVWRLGDAIFSLKDQLAALSLEVDGLYLHLMRDLGVDRKWLEKVVTLRRYLPEEALIPESLNWGRCEKGTRRIAEKLRTGVPLD